MLMGQVNKTESHNIYILYPKMFSSLVVETKTDKPVIVDLTGDHILVHEV